jgi:hypothetical protein
MAISSANKLIIYNGALLFIGERSLSALTDNVESRRLLDRVWDGGGVDKCLERGQWKFATRASKLDYTSSITPDDSFIYNRAFEKPSDLIRLCALCSDGGFKSPLLDYDDNSGFWFASLDELYIQYVSNDGSYGTDYSLWPGSFKRFVEAWFGCEIVLKLTQSESKEELKKKEMNKLLSEAKSKDAMDGPTKFMPPGRFRADRHGSRGSSDYGYRSRLIG